MASNDLEELCPPRKRVCRECIIHCTDDDSELVSPRDNVSWQTLLNAANVRKHEALLNVAKHLTESEVPTDIYYHRKCRSLFTLKKSLSSLLRMKTPDNYTEKSETKLLRKSQREEPGTSKVYDRQCIFCENTSKYKRNQNTREPLIQCQDLCADEKIRDAATRKSHSRILVLLSRDLVASKGHYHSTCYKKYTKLDDYGCPSSAYKNTKATDDSYEVAVNKAYGELFIFIRNELLSEPKVVPLTFLTLTLERYIHDQGICKMTLSTKKHVRRKLENEFGEILHFVTVPTGQIIVYPDCLSADSLAQQVYTLQNDLEVKHSELSDKITGAAIELRKSIRDLKQTQWPPDTSKNVIPLPIERFLVTLITGDNECERISDKVRRHVTSIGNDLVFATTNGRIKPAKHILLPFAIKSLTGNVELIQILNRLGHSISRTQYEEINTALCVQKLDLVHNQKTFLPNAYPNIPTTVAWDNIDRLEGTLSGGGTSHRVNGIAIQPCVEGPSLPDTPLLVEVVKSKKRSISAGPLELPVYNAGERQGPPIVVTQHIEATEELQNAKQKNMLWFLSRFLSEDKTVSSWTGFNIKVRNDIVVVQDTISYLPTINAPATQMSTVNEVLEQTLKIMRGLDLNAIVCIFDQALYAKAAEIVWKREKFKGIIIRMGTFHTICNMLGIIGKRFQHAGLEDICVEAGVLAEGSVAAVMEGRRYNRAIRVHKLIYEALLRLAWKGFQQWLEEKHSGDVKSLRDVESDIQQFKGNICQEEFDSLLECNSCKHILDLFHVYTESLRQLKGLSAFWLTYIDMVEIVLNLIRASREGNWALHLGAIKQMIPWCFAYDRINYARFLPYYYASMTRLQSDHPDVYEHFLKGGFSVQIGDKNPFGRIPVDQAIEETVNRDTQTAGGTKGFSLNNNAIAKYHLTAEFRSTYLRQIREMVSKKESEVSHPDLQSTRVKKDLFDVDNLEQMLTTSLINPFNPENQEIVCLTTAVQAPDEVAKDLREAKDIGENAYERVKEERLATATGFFNTLAKKRLKTFSDVGIKPISCNTTKNVVLKADRKLFGQMILVAESRSLHMEEVLAHPLGPLPWSLANSDGSLRKTNKAVLARELEKHASPIETIPQPSACIIDGMALLHKLQGNDKTFGYLADSALGKIILEGTESKRIDVVFDVYRDVSIKNAERARRGFDKGIRLKHIASGHTIKQWRKLLCFPQNKTSLVRFLVEEWKRPDCRRKLADKILFVTCDNLCLKLSRDVCEEIPELSSTQEEADTRLLLHAKHAAYTGSKAIVISAEDTDVTVIGIAMSNSISCPMYQKAGTRNRVRFTNISKVSKALGGNVSKALIGMHAFTGCDTVSAFCGRGKVSVLKQTKSDIVFQQAFGELGCNWDMSTKLFTNLQQIVCKLYLSSSNTGDVNRLRYQLFCIKRGDLDSSQLPPCKDALFLHALRANYQACIWRRSVENDPIIPHPKCYGWKLDEDNELRVEWIKGSPAPEAVLDLLACTCVRACKADSCTCITNGLKCTDMCRLQTCSNQASEESLEHYVDSESEIDSDSGDQGV